MWQQTPWTTTAGDVEDRIQNFAPRMFARATSGLFFRKVWRKYVPFGIIKVSRVSLSGFGHPASLPDFSGFVEFSDAL
jgi:hypothetical protein